MGSPINPVRFSGISRDLFEYVLAFPFVSVASGNFQILVIKSTHHEDAGGIPLLFIQDKPQRFGRKISKSNIRKVPIVADRDDDRRVIVFKSMINAVEDPCRHQARVESQ
jgi:hypothetical protein